ncbi:acyl transferase/acyl hydrolase/lysophospholipase [Limtongia smithiae]|uniref:acyl transferase/acyl hydrolase/lysophospholipase n=1 Tax=Limtongia smithiae TaxID=1125753 RepID=UPI0034D01F20
MARMAASAQRWSLRVAALWTAGRSTAPHSRLHPRPRAARHADKTPSLLLLPNSSLLAATLAVVATYAATSFPVDNDDSTSTPPQSPPKLKPWEYVGQQYSDIQAKVSKLLDSNDTAAVLDFLKDSLVLSISIPVWIRQLQSTFALDDKDSLGSEMIQESSNAQLNPEIDWTPAHVRLGVELAPEEDAFRKNRVKFTRLALATYLDIPLETINPRDVPVIAVTGSGGGYRALIAGAGYLSSLESSGLLDCVTYMSGVSGSTWLLALYFTLGNFDTRTLIDHIKQRVGIHIAYLPAVMDLCTTPPTDKFLLHGLIQKLYYKYTDVSLADIYGIMLASRLLIPDRKMILHNDDLKISRQRDIVDTGTVPMPIYTAVRHELGLDKAQQQESDTTDIPSQVSEETIAEIEHTRKQWFQWFEVSPYEAGFEELQAWIPTYALGRKWQAGSSIEAPVPELNLTLLLGTFGSAFCATLSHFYKEIRPVLPGDIDMIQKLDYLVSANDDDLRGVHPITPASIPNYILGLQQYLPKTCPESLLTAKNINLMDAGMDNNLAFYPLLRPQRNVDMIIAFDCSADIQDVPWLDLTAEYAEKHGIAGWPSSACWPKKKSEAASTINKAGITEEKMKGDDSSTDMLGPVSIWTGVVHTDSPETQQSAITLVYCPLISHYDSDHHLTNTEFMSTWNFVYTPEEVDSVVNLASTNFNQGQEQVREAVRAIYKQKREQRLAMEQYIRTTWKKSILHGVKESTD